MILNRSAVVLWSKGKEGGCRSSVRFVQVFSDKTATILNTTGIALYPVHFGQPNSSARIGVDRLRTA